MPVYFARIGGRHGPIKIGHSFNPEQRLKGLANKYRKDITIIALVPGDTLEFDLHERFKAHHCGPANELEMFNPVREILDFLRPYRLSSPLRKKYRGRGFDLRPLAQKSEVDKEVAKERSALHSPQSKEKLRRAVMSVLDKVKKWMQFYGWQNGGNPGSVKLDADRKVIATHGDETWIKDVEEACEAAEREAARDERVRRDAERRGTSATSL